MAFQKKHLYSTGVGLAAGLLFILLLNVGLLSAPEWRLDDSLARMSARPGRATDEVALVLLDQKSLDWAEETLGLSWPWPREMYSLIVEFAAGGGAKALGFDVIYSEPSFYGSEDDFRFGSSLDTFGRGIGTVVVSEEYGSKEWPKDLPLPSGGAPAGGLESFDYAQFPIEAIGGRYAALANVQVLPDADGVHRRVAPAVGFAGYQVPSMALAMYRIGGEGRGIITRENGRTYLDGRRLRSDRQGNLVLRFRGPSGTHPTYNAAEIMNSQIQIYNGQEPQLSPDIFRDKYVLFGFSAPGLKDQRTSPLGKGYTGVEIHATMLDNLLSGEFFLPVVESGSVQSLLFSLSILLVSMGAALAVTGVNGFRNSIFVFAAFVLGSVLITAPLYFAAIDLPVVPFFGATVFSLALAFIVNYATEGRQRRFLKGAFGQYLSPDVINQMLQNPEGPKLGGEKRALTIFFSDLQGFTTISEGLDPEGLTALLNEYLTAMSRIIMAEGGTIDKFEGDAIIAFWNAPLDLPDHASRGVRAALRCQEVLAEMRADLKAKAGGKDVLMRIGMNTGEAVVGNMGSIDRFDYTMLGDSVNLAARLEGVNKQFGTYTMISRATLDAARGSGEEFFARELARVEVVGKSEPVTVYEPMSEQEWRSRADVLKQFDRALRLFYEGQFTEAREGFAALAPEDAPAGRYVDKIDAMGGRAPEDWKGVWVMTSK